MPDCCFCPDGLDTDTVEPCDECGLGACNECAFKGEFGEAWLCPECKSDYAPDIDDDNLGDCVDDYLEEDE